MNQQLSAMKWKSAGRKADKVISDALMSSRIVTEMLRYLIDIKCVDVSEQLNAVVERDNYGGQKY